MMKWLMTIALKSMKPDGGALTRFMFGVVKFIVWLFFVLYAIGAILHEIRPSKR